MKEFLDIWAQSTEMKKMLKFGVGITITHQKKYIYHYHIPKVLSTGGDLVPGGIQCLKSGKQ